MPADTFLQLGDFTFSRFEIPERIKIGGEQALAVQRIPGGARTVDAMGPDDAPLEWSGIFMGATALDRARYLNSLRIAGKVLNLTWSEFDYDVVIKSFTADFERWYNLPYSISCVVVKDNTLPIVTIADPGIDFAITDDMGNALGLSAAINDGPLSSLMSTLNTAVGAVSSFAKAAQSTINGVLQPLAAVQARVGLLVSSVGSTISNVGTLGGILPNTPIAQQASKLTAQVGAMTQLPQLYNLQSVLSRMGGNLGTIGNSGSPVTSAGGNLYQMAANAYGDAMAWPTIAKANNLTDPMLGGIQTVTVPPQGGDTGGVLSA